LAAPEAKVAVEIEELPPMGVEEAKIREVIALIAQRVKPLQPLSESEEEVEGERIARVMSSFFEADEDEAKKDIAGTTLALKDSMLPATDRTGPSNLGFEWITVVVTPSAIMVAEGSSKPTLAEDKGKGSAKFEVVEKAIKDDTPLGEGPFDQDLGGRRYQVHHVVGKMMGTKQLAKAIGFAEQLGYPSRTTIFGGGPNDYLYCCPDNMETEVCHQNKKTLGMLFPTNIKELRGYPHSAFTGPGTLEFCLAFLVLQKANLVCVGVMEKRCTVMQTVKGAQCGHILRQ
jgi:hypothetical protein